MYSIVTRRWFFPFVLALALIAEPLVLRTMWATDTQTHPRLGRLQVGSQYELMLENPASTDAQPILSFNGAYQHNHRLAVDIHSGRLSDQSLPFLTAVNPPKNSGRLIFSPDSSASRLTGPPCFAALTVEFPPQAKAQARSVEIWPPVPNDILDPSSMRLLHLRSSSPVAIGVSANPRERRDDGDIPRSEPDGPGCRNVLSIAVWKAVIPKNLGIVFIADPGTLVDLTLSAKSFPSEDIDSLEIEPFQVKRLLTLPAGLTRVIQSRTFAGPPPLKLTGLQLSSSFLTVKLEGRFGISVAEFLGWTKWPIVALLDLPLLALAIQVFRLRKTIFLSYSRTDREPVMSLYQRMRQAGLDVWIDREQLRGGVDWEQRIRARMLKCRRVVIFLSHSLNDGGFFLVELGLARAIAEKRSKRSAFLIPVRLENCPIPPILLPWNAIDLFEPDGERRLFADLGAGGAAPEPLPEVNNIGTTGPAI
jgi:hypothetical protein